jgi:hypothetical protein
MLGLLTDSILGLGCAEIDEATEKEDGEDVEHPVLSAGSAGDDLEDGEADEAEG